MSPQLNSIAMQAERSKAQALLAETREAIRELKAQIEDKEMTLNPYQAEKKAAFQERESQRIGRHAAHKPVFCQSKAAWHSQPSVIISVALQIVVYTVKTQTCTELH